MTRHDAMYRHTSETQYSVAQLHMQELVMIR